MLKGKNSLPEELVLIWKKLNCPGAPRRNQKSSGVGRVVQWSLVNFQCRGVLQFGL